MVSGEQAPPPARQVVIVGGGISGLSAAWWLEQAAQAHGLNLTYTLLEASPRLGGKVLTEQVAGPDGAPFVVEAGPDSFITQKPWGVQLVRALGLDDRLLGTNDKQRHTYVLHKGKPVRLPDGVMLLVPTKFRPFVFSPLISPLGKLRMGMDLILPRRRTTGDETLAGFVQRRLGREALDKIAEPLLSGIYNAEADKQSMLATFPRFRQIEEQHRSLILGMVAARAQRAAAPAAGAAPASAFMSLRTGTQELIDALAARLHGDLRTGVRVTALAPAPGGGYRVTTGDGATITADAVLLTTPAYTAAELLRPLQPAAADLLDAIRYVSTGTISLAFRQSDLTRPLNGFGVVVPASERRPINAITISSTKFAQRAPAGFVLLRVFFGGSRSPATMALDDEQLVQVVRGELRTMLGIEAAPRWQRIYRWPRANPQYDVNHLDLVGEIEAALPQGIYMAGSALRGVGLPDCIHQAQMTVARLVGG